jgi:hypothetical protein
MIEVTVANKEYQVQELGDLLIAEAAPIAPDSAQRETPKGVLLVSPFTHLEHAELSITQFQEAEKLCAKSQLQYSKLDPSRLLWIMQSFGNTDSGVKLKKYFIKGIRTELDTGVFFHPNLEEDSLSVEYVLQNLEALFGEQYYVGVPRSRVRTNISDCHTSRYTGRFLSKRLVV